MPKKSREGVQERGQAAAADARSEYKTADKGRRRSGSVRLAEGGPGQKRSDEAAELSSRARGLPRRPERMAGHPNGRNPPERLQLHQGTSAGGQLPPRGSPEKQSGSRNGHSGHRSGAAEDELVL